MMTFLLCLNRVSKLSRKHYRPFYLYIYLFFLGVVNLLSHWNLNNKNTQVIGISIDGPFANKFFKEHYQLNFPLLSDYNREVIKKYNVVMKDLATLKDYNAAKRAIFIIDKDKKITYRWISDNPLIEPDYQEIITNLQ